MTMLASKLVFCRCGHSPDRHVRGGACTFVNPERTQRDGSIVCEQLCSCAHFECDPRLADGELLARGVLEARIRRENIPFEPAEHEELLGYLVADLWLASEAYDSRSHIAFRVYAYTELSFRAIDHIRRLRGRHGQHRVVDSRLAEAARRAHGDGDGAAEADPLVEPSGGGAGDDPDDWLADGGGLLQVGDRAAARGVGAAGRPSAARARAGGPRGGAGGDRVASAAGAGAARRAAGAAFVDCRECGWRNYSEPPNGVPGWHPAERCGGCGAELGVAA